MAAPDVFAIEDKEEIIENNRDQHETINPIFLDIEAKNGW
jgi:hypothetical protein